MVEVECEEFWREIYKIQKQFNNLIKKRKLELQAKLSEKRKSKSNEHNFFVSCNFFCNKKTFKFIEKVDLSDKDPQNAQKDQDTSQGDQQQQQQPSEPLVDEKDDDEKELEKLERGDPEMIKICNVIMSQLDEFKVMSRNLFVLRLM